MMTVLLVEDNIGDIELTKEAFKTVKTQLNIEIVRDGIEAVAYLHQIIATPEATFPDLILLDLNLPRKSGCEVLSEIRADERFRHIPVVVLTTSEAKEDIFKSYQIGANAYVSKPLSLDGLLKMVHSLEAFWFTVAKLPPHLANKERF
jgi:two-component system, chemotaxis family, response regulator Rcp1